MRLQPTIAVLALVLVLSSGCDNAAPTVTVTSLRHPLSGPCSADTGDSEFTSEVEALRATIAGDGIASALNAEANLGDELSLEVPPGPNRNAALFGLVGSAAIWRGVRLAVDIPETGASLDFLMGRIGDLSCSRNVDDVARVFHTATRLADGRVLIAGGASESSPQTADCPFCRRYEATDSAVVYSPSTGTFTPVAPMTSARMFHTATLLDDGSVVIIGGAASALVSDGHPLPLLPQEPVSSVEVFDAAENAFRVVADDPGGGRSFAATAKTVAGEVIITGGILEGIVARNDLSNALSSTTICGGAPLACRFGPPMSSRRAGHVAFTSAPDGTFIFGGSIDTEGDGFQPETLGASDSAFSYLQAQAMTTDRNLFFAAPSQYVSFRLLVAGGLLRDTDGDFLFAETDSQAPVFVYDLSADEGGGIVSGTPGDARLALRSRRWFASAAALPTELPRVMIAGGFETLTLETSSSDIDVFDEGRLVVEGLSVGGVFRTLRERRGALRLTGQGDGGVLISGGDAAGELNRTAEIFTDTASPAGIVE